MGTDMRGAQQASVSLGRGEEKQKRIQDYMLQVQLLRSTSI